MISITQDLKFKQAVVEYSFKHGVTAAAKRYKRTRQWIYYWRKTLSGNADRKETFQPTLFQKVLMAMGIRHKQIRPYTPRHNGKVERSHRKDNEMFYAKKTFYSLEDYNKQLRRYMNEYNNFPMRPLGWKSPNEFLSSFFSNV